MSQRTLHEYGGPWSELKLTVLSKYLQFYTTALRPYHFELWYIDGFAGTGWRDDVIERDEDMFGPAVNEVQAYDGSARIALQNDPPFDRHIFIENDLERFEELSSLKGEFPKKKIECFRGDANQLLPKLAEELSQRSRRAIVFLDPYNLAVAWSTIVTLARTQRVDLWYLLNIAAVFRQAAHNRAGIDQYKIDHLNSAFGGPEWLEELYSFVEDTEPTLPGLELAPVTRRCSKDRIDEWFLGRRLKKEFVDACGPLPLPNRIQQRLSLFCAASNKKGAPIAMRVGSYIIGRGKSSQRRS